MVFLLPFVGIGILLQRRAKKKDPEGERLHFGLVSTILLPILIGSLVTQIFYFFIPLLLGVCGAMLMLLVGLVFVLVYYPAFRFIKKTRITKGVFEGLCIIPKHRTRVRTFKEAFFGSIWDRIILAFRFSPMALAIAFFLSALVANQLESSREIWDNYWIMGIMLLAPIISVIISPIQLVFDSSIVLLNRKNIKKAIQIRYLGEKIRKAAQNITGFGAVIAFISVIVDIYTDSLLDPITIIALSDALFLILTWSLTIFAALYLVMFVYTFFHEPLLKMFNRRILKLDLPVYVIEESTDGKEIRLRQVELRSDDIEEILKDGQIDESDLILERDQDEQSIDEDLLAKLNEETSKKGPIDE